MWWRLCYAHSREDKWSTVILNSSRAKSINLHGSWLFPLTTNSSFLSHESQPKFAAEQCQLDPCPWDLESPKATFNLVFFYTVWKNSEGSKRQYRVWGFVFDLQYYVQKDPQKAFSESSNYSLSAKPMCRQKNDPSHGCSHCSPWNMWIYLPFRRCASQDPKSRR